MLTGFSFSHLAYLLVSLTYRVPPPIVILLWSEATSRAGTTVECKSNLTVLHVQSNEVLATVTGYIEDCSIRSGCLEVNPQFRPADKTWENKPWMIAKKKQC